MKVEITRKICEEIEMSHKDIIETAIKSLKETANLKYQWINQNGNLEYETHTSHSYYEEKGKPSLKQIQASNLIKELQDYLKFYL